MQIAEVSIGEVKIRLQAAVCGGVLEVNPLVIQDPQLMITDPEGRGWIALILCNNQFIKNVLTPPEYVAYRQAHPWTDRAIVAPSAATAAKND